MFAGLMSSSSNGTFAVDLVFFVFNSLLKKTEGSLFIDSVI